MRLVARAHSFSLRSRHLPCVMFMVSVLFLLNATAVRAEAVVLESPTLSKASIVVLTNADRVRWGVEELTRSPLLDFAAQMKANHMAIHGYFSHTGPQGQDSWHWFTVAGYFYTSAGENLAINFSDPTVLQKAWMASPTHRANIVRDIYTETGVGVAQGMYRGESTTFVVQFFAKPAYQRYFAKSLIESRFFQRF